MKFSSAAVLLSTAVGVSAHPSGHAHQLAHRAQHERRADFVMAQKPAETVAYSPPAVTSVAPPPPPPPSPTYAAPAPKPTQGGGKGTFCGGNSKRATNAQIAYEGNIGAPGQYGCNIKTIDAGSAGDYDYTIQYENKSGQKHTCSCWNKIGPDGGINGFFKGNQAINFDIPAGATQFVAIESNSQGACACSPGDNHLFTAIGEFAAPWLEFDMNSTPNNNWSGADASCLVAAAAGLPITPLNVCHGSQCSTIYSGGTGKNAYLAGMEAVDGTGLNIPPGIVNLVATLG